MELTSLVRAAKGSREQQVNWVTGDMGTCPLCLQAPASRDGPTGTGSSSQGRAGRAWSPVGFNAARTTRQGHRPSHPSPTASRDFHNCKKKPKNKPQAKNVINIRANCRVWAIPRPCSSHPDPAVPAWGCPGAPVGSSSTGAAPSPICSTRGLCIPPSLGSSKFFPNHLPTHKTFCAPLICVISLS